MRLLESDTLLVTHLAFSSDGLQLWVRGIQREESRAGIVLSGRTFDLADLGSPMHIDYDYRGRCWFAISSDRRWHAFAFDHEHRVHLEICRGGEGLHREELTPPGTFERLTALTFAPFSATLAIGFENWLHRSRGLYIRHGLCLWDLEEKRVLAQWATGSELSEISCAPDGRHIAVNQGRGNCIWLFDRSGHKTLPKLATRDLHGLTFSGAGTYLAAAGKSVVIWNTATWKRAAVLRGQDEDVPSLAFSPDERILAVARTDGPVEFWEVESGHLLRRYNWDIGRLSAIAFAPDGLTCAVAGTEGRIVVWDLD